MKPFAEQMETSGMNSRDGEHENLQWSLSITNVPCSVFEDENTKRSWRCFQQLVRDQAVGLVCAVVQEVFENLFTPYCCENERNFIYLKSFHRVRVTLNSEENAKAAQRDIHKKLFNGSELGVFFVQRCFSLNNNSTLMPPPPTKQFLISPPASPPVGWQQTLESHPIVNYDLLAAVATLDTSRPHELHSSAEDAPSIVVHLCDENSQEVSSNEEDLSKFHPLKALPREITQTRRPGVTLKRDSMSTT